MTKKKNSKTDYKMFVVILLVLAIFTSSAKVTPDTTHLNDTNDTDTTSPIGGGIFMGGGGGGGSTPPAPVDTGCVGECPAVWVEDEPVKSTRGGLLDLFNIQLIPLSTGSWSCEGLCKNEAELCIFNPTDVIPDGGYTNKDNPPECVCLRPQPGACNFYDANYGVGEENIICGGSCPFNSQCMKFNSGDVDVCRCLNSPYSDECGMHYPEQYLKSSSGELVVPNDLTEDNCYGYCTIATLCTFGYDTDFDIKARVPICYCPELQDQDQQDEPDTIIYCESIENPRSQSDCDVGACTVLMYGVECLFGIDKESGNNICYCGLPEDVEPTEPLKVSILPDTLLKTTTVLYTR